MLSQLVFLAAAQLAAALPLDDDRGMPRARQSAADAMPLNKQLMSLSIE